LFILCRSALSHAPSLHT